MNLDHLKKIALSLNCLFKEREVIAPYTRLKIGGKSLFYIKPLNWESCCKIIKFISEEKIPFKILGNGTNLLISDKNLNFGVVHILNFEKQIIFRERRVKVSADSLLSKISEKSFAKEMSGLEEISLIPGTVGGACYMNAGAFGKTIFDLLEKIWVIDYNGNEKEFLKNTIEFGYRKTNIKDLGVIKSVEFNLKFENRKIIEEKVKEFKHKRDLSQPWKERTCGSVFKNLDQISAGKLLDSLGFKGRRRGNVRFSEKHANFLITEDGAKFEDAFALIEEARLAAEKKGFSLEYEMEVWNCVTN